MKPNIIQDAKQTMQGAQPNLDAQISGQPPQTPDVAGTVGQASPATPQGLPVPPPQVAMHLAQMAQTLDPIVLGTLIWRALKEHGESLNAQGANDLGGGQPPQPGGAV